MSEKFESALRKLNVPLTHVFMSRKIWTFHTNITQPPSFEKEAQIRQRPSYFVSSQSEISYFLMGWLRYILSACLRAKGTSIYSNEISKHFY